MIDMKFDPEWLLRMAKEEEGVRFSVGGMVSDIASMKPPRVLNKMVDVVLAYRPESKVKPPKERKKSTKRLSDAESKKRESTT